MDCGGTFQIQTYKCLLEESPEALDGFPEQELIAICDEIQRSEVPEMSRAFQEVFREFNRQYFARRLPDYEVRVVYDLGYWPGPWPGPSFHEGELGSYQREMQRILLRITDSLAQMLSTLIYEMARAASDGHPDGGWLDELRRLRKMGAPLGNIQIDWGPSV